MLSKTIFKVRLSKYVENHHVNALGDPEGDFEDFYVKRPLIKTSYSVHTGDFNRKLVFSLEDKKIKIYSIEKIDSVFSLLITRVKYKILRILLKPLVVPTEKLFMYIMSLGSNYILNGVRGKILKLLTYLKNVKNRYY